MTRAQKEIFFLVLITVLMLFLNLGFTPTNIMEARNFVTAKEILTNNDWIFTTLNGLPRYEKPPLPTWITAIFGKVFGFDNLFYLRIPVALISSLLVFYFYHLVKKFTNHFQAFLASLILITSFYIFFAGRDNNWDIYTHSFMIVGLFYLTLVFKTSSKLAYTIYLAFLASLGLAASIMSKGPVSLYALLLPFIIAYLIVYKANWKKNLIISLVVILVGCLIGFAWMFYVRTHDPEPFNHAATTEVSRWGSYNIRPFYYYWSFFTQTGIWTIPALISLFYPYLKNKVENKKAYIFALVWTFGSLILLSVIPEKKTRYILPTLIPLAFTCSFYINYLWQNYSQIKKKDLKIANFSFSLIGVIGFLILAVIPYLVIQKSFSYWSIPLVISGIFLGFIILKSLRRKDFSKVFYSTILLMVSVIAFGYPMFTVKFDNPKYTPKEVIHQIENQYQIKTYEATGFLPELVYLYGEPIKVIKKSKTELDLPKENRFGLMIDLKDSVFMDSVFGKDQYKKIRYMDFNKADTLTPFYNKRLTREYYLVEKK